MMARLGEKGVALVLVLLVTAAMTAIIAGIISTVHGQLNRTSNFIEGQKAAQAAEGGFELAARYLKTLNRDYIWLGTGTFATQVEGMVLEVTVEDESGKLQTNSIIFPNGEVNEAARASYRSLLKSLGMEPSLSETLADWLDMDDVTRGGGAEGQSFYHKLPEPYAPKNGHLDSVGELALVKGYERRSVERLGRFLTVYSDGLVNINTAPKEVLMALSEEITPSMADSIIKRRDEKPFADASDIRSVSGFETLVFSLRGRIKVKSDIFRVRTRAISGGVVREVEAVVRTGGAKKVLYWRAR
jgi:general secretion pathway protein K